MVRCGSLLSQILSLVPRVEFAEIVRKHEAERHSKGFSSWDQFASMVFCQLGQANSLREISAGASGDEGSAKAVHALLRECPPAV